jgi:hypothetical protein
MNLTVIFLKAVNAKPRRWLEKNIKGFSDIKVGKIKDAIKKMRVCQHKLER